MDATHFDRIARLFAALRLSRRQAIVQGGAGLAAGLTAASLAGTAAQVATPDPAPVDAAPVVFPVDATGEKVPYLFLQSFQSGSIAPKAGAEGTYTVTLEHGLGQTIYFSDRPNRDVGTQATGNFLRGLGFDPDNPPNAALVMETAPGETDIAVVELLNPSYDEAVATLTYDVEPLANWESSLEMSVGDAPTDLAQLAPTFGAAHLFIDDCPDRNIYCEYEDSTADPNRQPDHQVAIIAGSAPMCWSWPVCNPCVPYYHAEPAPGDSLYYWGQQCNAKYPAQCQGFCIASV